MRRPLPSFWTAVAVCSLVASASAQITEDGRPASILDGGSTAGVPVVEVLPPDVGRLLAEDALSTGFPLRYGDLLEVDVSPDTHGRWDEAPNGDLYWRVGFHSAGAFSLGLELDDFWLPEGGQLFLYDEGYERIQGAYGARNNQPHEEIQLSPFPGDRVILEYRQPAGVVDLPRLHVGTLIHDYRDLFAIEAQLAAQPGGLGGDGDVAFGSCFVDANCPEGDEFPDQRRAVARTLGSGALCSGAMINNTSQDGTQYFLTAWHCGQGSNTIFRFNYQTSGCGTGSAPTNQEVSGATVLASDQPSDGRLLRINNTIPDSYGVYFPGWNKTELNPSLAYAFSHPAGGPKKLSLAAGGAGKVAVSIGGIGTIPAWAVYWTLGSITGGSSGGPLYDQSGRIRGFASGAPDVSCPTATYYGRLRTFWNNSSLGQWLDPLDLGLNAIYGMDPLDPGSVIPPGSFEVDTVEPATVDVVAPETTQTFQLKGIGFEGSQDLLVNGASINGFPSPWQVINDSTIEVTLRGPLDEGLMTLELVKGHKTETLNVAVVFNSEPTIDLEYSSPGFLISAIPLVVHMASQPGDVMGLFGSVSPLPSPVPGIVDLAIGDNLTSIVDLGAYVVDPGTGYVTFSTPISTSLPPGLNLYFQAASISAVAPVLPLATTNVETGTILF